MSLPNPPADTAPEAFAVHVALVAGLTAAERVRRVRELTMAASTLALAGLRKRHPRATEEELFLRLAVLRLGAELVERAYGWRAAADGA